MSEGERERERAASPAAQVEIIKKGNLNQLKFCDYVR